MEWREEDLGDEEGNLHLVDKACAFLREPSSVARPRNQKGKKEQGPTVEELAQKRRLDTHHELYKGEPEEFRLRRADAMQTCWRSLSGRIQETLDSTDMHVFQGLLQFAKERHQDPCAAARMSRDGYHRVPTALVLAGGVNSADHTQTFPNLVRHLKDQGLYVALLQPHSFGRVVGEALNEVLRQFSGLDTKAQHAEALMAWYRDEVGEPSPEPTAAPAPTPTAAEASRAQQQEQNGGRQLRQRPAAPLGGGRGRAASERQRGNWERPLVVVVEGTESLDPACLRDMLLTLSECYAQLPVTVMLGLTTAEGALHEMLSSEVTDRCMDCQSFRLASAMTRMNRLVSEVLLGGAGGGWPGLQFEYGVVSTLVNKFFVHYYSTGVLKHGLQLAAVEHFHSQPASFLAAPALDGPDVLKAACSKLPSAVAVEVKKRVEGRGGTRLADTVLEAMAAWSRWAVVLHWLVAAAGFVKLRKDFQYYDVYLDALDHRFNSTKTAGKLGDVQRHLRRLQPQQVCQLAGELEALAGRVAGVDVAMRQELQQLQDLAKEAAEPPQQAQQEDSGAQAPTQGAAQAAAAQAAGEDAQPPAGAAAKPAAAEERKKRDRFHSQASRRAALMEKATQAGVAAKGAAAAVAEKKAREASAPGAKLAAWLVGLVEDVLATPPTRVPGAAVFTCKGVGTLEGLSGSMRQVVHAALTQPQLFLEGVQEQVGCRADMDDACLAYTLFDQDPNCVNVADWFHSFRDVHVAAQQEQQGVRSGRKGKKAAVKKKKGKGGPEEEEDAGPSEEVQQQRQREVAARFSQGTGELQFLGLVKPAKRRRGDYVQRLVHMPAADIQ